MTQLLETMALVVTGAASGIGRAVVIEAATRGVHNILATDMNEQGLQSLVHEVPSTTRLATVVADLSEATAAADIAARAYGEFGRIDGLVNAAGITTRAGFLNGTAEGFDAIFKINTRAPFLLMQEAIRDMRARGDGGTIVNIQSMNAHCGTPELALYAASKGALQTLTKNAANSHLRDGIRVNGINLGWVRTEAEHRMQSKTLGQPDDWAERAGRSLPLGRLLEAEEAARLAVYLLSPESAPMTGVSIDLEQTVVGAPG